MILLENSHKPAARRALVACRLSLAADGRKQPCKVGDIKRLCHVVIKSGMQRTFLVLLAAIAVTAISTAFGVFARLRRSCASSLPSISGRPISSRHTSKCSVRARSKAVRDPGSTMTTCPVASRYHGELSGRSRVKRLTKNRSNRRGGFGQFTKRISAGVEALNKL
jgi:hypothetical protein